MSGPKMHNAEITERRIIRGVSLTESRRARFQLSVFPKKQKHALPRASSSHGTCIKACLRWLVHFPETIHQVANNFAAAQGCCPVRARNIPAAAAEHRIGDRDKGLPAE